MITISKIIYNHSEDCNNPDVKHIGNRKYTSEEVNIELKTKKELEQLRNRLIIESGFKSIDFRYIGE